LTAERIEGYRARIIHAKMSDAAVLFEAPRQDGGVIEEVGEG